MADLTERLAKISLIVSDVDGVLANGITLLDSGMEAKIFNVKDGFGFKMAKHAGMQTAILTARVCEAVAKRAKMLSIDYYEAGHSNKLPALLHIMASANVTESEVLYVGDDIPDLICKQGVGVFAAPLDAASRVLREADMITTVQGGQGVIREVVEAVLQAKKILTETENFFIGV